MRPATPAAASLWPVNPLALASRNEVVVASSPCEFAKSLVPITLE